MSTTEISPFDSNNSSPATRMPALPRLSPVPPSTLVPNFKERKGWRRQANMVFVITLSLYLVIACWLAFDVQYYLGDALSRTQAAQSIIFSRNPNLSVMGFVFTPLTTVLQLPLVSLTPWIPAMSSQGLAGAIISALFMAGSARELWLIASERGVRFWYAVAVIAIFAVHPMTLLYGATGMSEAPFIYGVLWASRRLIRWTSTDGVHDLVVAGFALALAFLARYDALVMAFVVMLLLGAMTWYSRFRRQWADRAGFAFLDMLVLGWPIGLAFITWSVFSWMSTGELLAQFTSQYGNSAILEVYDERLVGTEALREALMRTFIMSPILPFLVPVTLFLAWKRRDLEPCFPMVMMLAVLAFQILTYTLGSTFGFLRFFIIALPLTCVLLIQLFPPGVPFPTLRPGAMYRPRPLGRKPGRMLQSLLILLFTSSVVLTTSFLDSSQWAPQEQALKQVIPGADRGTFAEQEHRIRVLKTFSTERYIAEHLDSMELEEGQVLTSAVQSFAVLTSSRNQKQFVIPSDEDFITRLNNPVAHGVRYILVSPSDDRGTADPINMRYPEIYETGGTIATLELEFENQGEGQPDWRLYRVLS